MHSNHEYFWRAYELNEYIHKICMHSLLRPLVGRALTEALVELLVELLQSFVRRFNKLQETRLDVECVFRASSGVT